MLDQAILDFIVSEILLNAIPIVVLVAVIIEIIKSITEKYGFREEIKAFLPLISLVIGGLSVICLPFIFPTYAIMTRIIYGGIVGVLTNGLYDQIKGLLKLKDYFNRSDKNESE